MSLLVQKFGGTSVGSLERIAAVAAQIADAHRGGAALIVVVSAMSGETDRLFRLAHQVNAKPSARELASLITTGEQISMNLLALCLHGHGVQTLGLTGTQAGVRTSSNPLAARIESIDTQTIHDALAQRRVVIVAGFQGVDATGNITALGRGGSDTSAVALAAVFQARECQIYTDVDAIYSADPRLVPHAQRLTRIAMPLMLELASLGAKVLQLRSVELAGKYQVPLRVLSSFHVGAGTLIDYNAQQPLEAPVYTALAHKTGLSQFSLTLVAPLATLLQHFEHIAIEHFHYHPSQVLTLYVDHDADEALSIQCDSARQQGLVNAWHSYSGFARLALVGQGVRSHLATLRDFFAVMQTENIIWHDFFSSECALSLILNEADLALAAQALHRFFFEAV